MSSTASDRGAPRPLDVAALAHVRHRLQRQAQPPWLHGEVARRLAERLALIRRQPPRILDWGAFVGAGRPWLEQAYPQAQITAVEADESRRQATAAALQRPWWQPWGRGAPPVLRPAEVVAGSADLLWANMVLHGVLDPQQELQTWHRALAVDGFLMFATLGPGTLQGLTRLYASAGWVTPLAPFVDMHDLGDMLVQAGFADPVMDQETLRLTWTNADAALAELRGLGGNTDPGRHPGLRTPRWRAELATRLAEQAGADGRIALDFEIVYGHAFKIAPRPRVSGETSVSLEDMRAMVRRGGPPV